MLTDILAPAIYRVSQKFCQKPVIGMLLMLLSVIEILSISNSNDLFSRQSLYFLTWLLRYQTGALFVKLARRTLVFCSLELGSCFPREFVGKNKKMALLQDITTYRFAFE